MNNPHPLNAFQCVRPKGKDIPAALPKQRSIGAQPSAIRKGMDRNGRFTVDMAPRTTGAISIESGAAAQASVDKRRAISPRGMK